MPEMFSKLNTTHVSLLSVPIDKKETEHKENTKSWEYQPKEDKYNQVKEEQDINPEVTAKNKTAFDGSTLPSRFIAGSPTTLFQCFHLASGSST